MRLLESSIEKFKKKTGFTLPNIEPEGMNLWNLKQFDLAVNIFNRVIDIISASRYKQPQKDDLKNALAYLFEKALPFFVDGMDKNPIHHNVQVVENMLIIAIQETKSHRLDKSYKFVRKAAVLALLHDIGSGFSNPGLRKIKSSDIKDREQELFKGEMPKEEIEKEISGLIEKAVEYRMVHMIEGAKIAENLLNEFNRDQKKFNGVTFNERDIQDIKKCIERHDLPCIAEYYVTLGKPCNKNYLIQLDNPLAVILREADRLWMVSKEGLEKDLFEDLEKNKKPEPLLKLKHNVNRFKEETLFRTKSGLKLLKQYLLQRIDELNIKYDRKNTNIIEFVLQKENGVGAWECWNVS
ncbi:MAG: HD domain-containing protein, partial [Candidatus Aminicenantes bacterium]